jgi:hypothetical protein
MVFRYNISVRAHLVILGNILLAASCVSLFGQSYQGGIRRTVSDVQRAAVANAKVLIVNEATR